MFSGNMLRCGPAERHRQLQCYNPGALRCSSQSESMRHRHTVLEHYLFRARDGSMLMCLGLGMHNIHPSALFRCAFHWKAVP